MECKEALTLISAAVDGELGGAKLKEFEIHLQECEVCRNEYEAEKATKNILKQKLKKVKAPPSLVDAIRRQTMGNVPSNVQEFSGGFREQELVVPHASCFAAPSLAISSNFGARLKHLLFISPEDSKINTFFAFTLALCVLAMLVFTGFVRHQQSAFQDSAFSQREIETSKKSLNQLTGAAFERTLQTDAAPVTDYHSTVRFLTNATNTDAVLPLANGFFPHTVSSFMLGNIPAVEIKYYRKENPESTLSIFAMNAEDIQGSQFLPESIFQKISHDETAFVPSFSETGRKTVVWKWGNTIYSAISNESALDMTNGIFVNPKRIALK
ncbi:hypothetical protein Ctha_1264 [Chloroherpeton thalassium ATCC 35110]|uniref:Putative zinc-finger domain-containing protein n=1 Tax=Chloroherpeton thalassium (strain ATCC 35110 / GB-78) TaxID=517418 RepID=B3QZ34_CHLT3|nr:zf-HC2 domain-containing protein [Chloroherpeton thalassium]ACF13727.1 hypothetical protein Ctha_1264 [Chloroherpeton thalassium ATCC 35110]